MQVTKTSTSPTNLKLHISADSKDLAPIKKHVLGHFVKTVKVPGFRAGKAPAAMVEKHVNQQAMLDEFMDHAINDLYTKALDEQKLRPANQPKVELKKFVPYTSLEFEVNLEVIGKIKLADYKKIKLAKKPVEVTAKDVDQVIKNLQARAAERKPAVKAADRGDEVTIDFSGKDEDGKTVNGADGQDYPLIIGSDAFIPGFEDHLVGLKAGDEKQFELTFPADYGVAAMRSKKVFFSVKVKMVSEVDEPKLDDSFAPKVGPFKTMTELKADVKKQLKLERQADADRIYQNELIQKISDGSSVDIPASLIDSQIASMEEEEKRNLSYRGQTWQEHLDQEGISEDEHRERNRPEAEQRVKGGLILSEIAEIEKLVVTPEELEIRLQVLREQYKDPAMRAELDNPDNQREIAARLLTEKTVAKLASYASKG